METKKELMYAQSVSHVAAQIRAQKRIIVRVPSPFHGSMLFYDVAPHVPDLRMEHLWAELSLAELYGEPDFEPQYCGVLLYVNH
jgi:hypothetical protein